MPLIPSFRRQAPKKPTTLTWEQAVKLCKEVLALTDDLPERAEDYADSVQKKVSSIQEWIEDHKHVTEKQIEAVENMKHGCERWAENQ